MKYFSDSDCQNILFVDPFELFEDSIYYNTNTWIDRLKKDFDAVPLLYKDTYDWIINLYSSYHGKNFYPIFFTNTDKKLLFILEYSRTIKTIKYIRLDNISIYNPEKYEDMKSFMKDVFDAKMVKISHKKYKTAWLFDDKTKLINFIYNYYTSIIFVC